MWGELRASSFPLPSALEAEILPVFLFSSLPLLRASPSLGIFPSHGRKSTHAPFFFFSLFFAGNGDDDGGLPLLFSLLLPLPFKG